MFTGLIEEMGTVLTSICGTNSGEISIKANRVLTDTKIGDSIAVNGVCLTVTKLLNNGFTADVMPETFRRTNLGNLKNGDLVNLERAMPAYGRFGGHIVSGHIDGTGHIQEIKKEENAVWVRITADECILQLIVEKGSITIDGISLTVASVSSDSFQVSIIPHTGSETTLLKKKVGDLVNLENDMIGKYVKRMLEPFSSNEKSAENESRITLDFLKEHGF